VSTLLHATVYVFLPNLLNVQVLVQIANKMGLQKNCPCLPSRCLAMKEWIHFPEPLSSSNRSYTHTDSQTDVRDL
jgi:hypothetical protein